MKTFLIIMIVALLLASGCAKTEKPVEIIKVNDGCLVDTDCGYVWFAGGCHTQEYIDARMIKCRDGSGPCLSEAPPRENVTCSCEKNVCATHG